MANAPGARFRTKKISIKAPLQVLRESEIPDFDEQVSAQRSVPQVETGVDKEEEEEHHLKEAINAHIQATAAGNAAAKPVYIPTPDASRQAVDFAKYYSKGYTVPGTSIRFSTTVEDAVGCPYCMDEEDEEWLESLDKSQQGKVSPLALEWIMSTFESVTNERQPFLSMDPSQVLSCAELESGFDDTPAQEFKHLAKLVYPHWKKRRVANNGRPLMAMLRFEENEKDDGDPYVCFRRREVRQIRKTRRSDAQSSEKLRRLRADMAQARSILELVMRRDKMQIEATSMDLQVFESRCAVKETKRKLGIKDSDEDLISAPKKKRQMDISAVPTSKALPVAPTRPAAPIKGEERMITLEEQHAEHNHQRSLAIQEALSRHREGETDWVDLTFALHMMHGAPSPDDYFRTVTTSLSPPPDSRSRSSSPDNLFSPVSEASSATSVSSRPSVYSGRGSYRQRVGRGGRRMLDRKGYSLRSRPMDPELLDRWKFDNGNDDDNVLELDEYSTEAVKARSLLWAGSGERSHHI